MKFCLSLIFAVLLFAPISAHSQTAEDRFQGKIIPGKVFGQKKAPPPTPDQIDEAIGIYDECKASEMANKYYNCDCVSADFLQSRTEQPNEASYNILMASRKKCANTVDIAGSSYERCLTWAPRLKNDYEEYCGCYANNFAKNFAKSPTDSIRGREIMMTNALNGCNNSNEIEERRARQNMINQLKKQGLYEALFPSAKTGQTPARN